jgi:hypothetical protein
MMLNYPVLADTNVYLTNTTPYPFDIRMWHTGATKLIPGNEYTPVTTKIGPWQVHEKLGYFNRNVGIKSGKLYQFFFELNTEYLPSTALRLKQQLQGKSIGSTMEIGFDSNGNIGKWTKSDEQFWKNPIFFSCRDKTGSQKEFMVRCRMYPAGIYDDVKYVISNKPWPDKNISYNTKDVSRESRELNILYWTQCFLNNYDTTISPEQIARAIGGAYDVLVLTEMFHRPTRERLLKSLKEQGYRYATCVLGEGFGSRGSKTSLMAQPIDQPYVVNFYDSKFGKESIYTSGGLGYAPDREVHQGGGVMIVSKWPIDSASEVVFSEDQTRTDPVEKYKGCVYAKINKNGFVYNIFGTSLDGYFNASQKGGILGFRAGIDRQAVVRNHKVQLEAIRYFIGAHSIPLKQPVIIAGNMNIDRYSNEYGVISEYLKVKDPWSDKGERYSIDYGKNILCMIKLSKLDPTTYGAYGEEGYPRNLDYVLYSSVYAQPTEAYSELRIMTSPNPYRLKDINLDIYDLSEHYAVYGYFNFRTHADFENLD